MCNLYKVNARNSNKLLCDSILVYVIVYLHSHKDPTAISELTSATNSLTD